MSRPRAPLIKSSHYAKNLANGVLIASKVTLLVELKEVLKMVKLVNQLPLSQLKISDSFCFAALNGYTCQLDGLRTQP